jgi:hypothetical protein
MREAKIWLHGNGVWDCLEFSWLMYVSMCRGDSLHITQDPKELLK